MHSYIHTHSHLYYFSIENHQFTLLSPILVQYHRVHSDFISVSICNFLSSVRNLALVSLIISSYCINPAFLTLLGLQYLTPGHCHHGGPCLPPWALTLCTRPCKHPFIHFRLHHVVGAATPIPTSPSPLHGCLSCLTPYSFGLWE